MTKVSSLRSLDAFADKSITSGLKYIWGGATRNTAGGDHKGESDETTFDYVGDVTNGEGSTLFGKCSGYATQEAFMASPAYKEFVRTH